jgi:16S rRNA (guanine(966)-N(2))-methyltransferase RsmD
MSSTFHLPIQAGKWKGKKIPAPSAIRGNSNFTPSLLKKSIFSILDSDFLSGNWEKENAVFVDVFAGSGQMGIEAVSRGFSKAILFELDRERFRILRDNISSFSGDFTLFHKDAFRFLTKLEFTDAEFPIFFMDPPYSFWENSKRIEELCEKIFSKYFASPILIQSPVNPKWENYEIRNLGNNFILIRQK